MTILGGENADLFSFTMCGTNSNDSFQSVMLRKFLVHTKVLLAMCLYVSRRDNLRYIHKVTVSAVP